jgi:hypothetical protein
VEGGAPIWPFENSPLSHEVEAGRSSVERADLLLKSFSRDNLESSEQKEGVFQMKKTRFTEEKIIGAVSNEHGGCRQRLPRRNDYAR